jgi:hypothetical protein
MESWGLRQPHTDAQLQMQVTGWECASVESVEAWKRRSGSKSVGGRGPVYMWLPGVRVEGVTQ